MTNNILMLARSENNNGSCRLFGPLLSQLGRYRLHRAPLGRPSPALHSLSVTATPFQPCKAGALVAHVIVSRLALASGWMVTTRRRFVESFVQLVADSAVAAGLHLEPLAISTLHAARSAGQVQPRISKYPPLISEFCPFSDCPGC